MLGGFAYTEVLGLGLNEVGCIGCLVGLVLVIAPGSGLHMASYARISAIFVCLLVDLIRFSHTIIILQTCLHSTSHQLCLRCQLILSQGRSGESRSSLFELETWDLNTKAG